MPAHRRRPTRELVDRRAASTPHISKTSGDEGRARPGSEAQLENRGCNLWMALKRRHSVGPRQAPLKPPGLDHIGPPRPRRSNRSGSQAPRSRARRKPRCKRDEPKSCVHMWGGGGSPVCPPGCGSPLGVGSEAIKPSSDRQDDRRVRGPSPRGGWAGLGEDGPACEKRA